jgi:anti-sigma-K factor RskA
MLVDKQRAVGVLFVWNLPKLETGQNYQAWLINAQGDRISGGIFIPEENQLYTTVVITSPKPLGEFSGLGVTVEPSGGSPAPTGPRVLKVDF